MKHCLDSYNRYLAIFERHGSMTIENVITGVHEEVNSVGGCENANINALKDFQVRKACSLAVGCEVEDVLRVEGKRPRMVDRADEEFGANPLKRVRVNGYGNLRVRRNVKWAVKLEEHWDGVEKKTPCLFKPQRAGLKSILKKEPVSCLSPVSMCLNASSSESSYTSDEDHQVANKPRRLKFKLRYGCSNTDAQSCMRHPLLSM